MALGSEAKHLEIHIATTTIVLLLLQHDNMIQTMERMLVGVLDGQECTVLILNATSLTLRCLTAVIVFLFYVYLNVLRYAL